MDRYTSESIEATIVAFILDLLQEDYCRIEFSRFLSTTDTCKIRVSLEDGHKVDVNDFQTLVQLKSKNILRVKPSIVGNDFELIVSNCIQFFESSNQILAGHIKKYRLVVVIIFFLFLFLFLFREFFET